MHSLQQSICEATCLKELVLKQTIDLGELETILLGCRTLEILRCDGGIDNLDGRDDPLEEPHSCHLKSFYCNNYESVSLGERQLCWILKSSVGSLRELEVASSASMTMNGNPGFSPFAGADFATLLCDLGSSLVRLALRDALIGNGALVGFPVRPLRLH
jgi:hypothetical protein